LDGGACRTITLFFLSRNNDNINNSDGNNNYFDHTDNDILDITTDEGNKFDEI